MKVKITKEVRGDIAILHLKGEMLGGPELSERFPDEFKKIIDEGIKKIVIDMEKIRRMNSTGLGILMRCYTSLKNSGGELKLVYLSESVKGVLLLTKLNTIFDIHRSLDDAVGAF